MFKKQILLLLSIILVPFMLVACSNEDNEKDKDKKDEEVQEEKQEDDKKVINLKDVTLDNIENGAVFVYSSEKNNRENFIKAFTKYSKELNVPSMVLDVNNEKDMEKINNYLSKYKEILPSIDKYYKLENKIYTPYSEELEQIRNDMDKMIEEYGENKLFNFSEDVPVEKAQEFFELNDKKMALEFKIEEKLRPAIDTMTARTHELHKMKENSTQPTFDNIDFKKEFAEEIQVVTSNAQISEEEVIEYLKLNETFVHNPEYYQLTIDNRYKNTPIVFVISDGIMQRIVTTEDRLIPSEKELEDPEIAEDTMKDVVGFHMNQPSDEAENMVEKMDNKETFIGFITSRYCQECKKITSLIKDSLEEDKVSVVDFTIAENQRKLNQYLLVNELEINIANPPTLVKVVDGKITETLNREDLIKEELNEDILEFEIQKDTINDFISSIK